MQWTLLILECADEHVLESLHREVHILFWIFRLLHNCLNHYITHRIRFDRNNCRSLHVVRRIGEHFLVVYAQQLGFIHHCGQEIDNCLFLVNLVLTWLLQGQILEIGFAIFIVLQTSVETLHPLPISHPLLSLDLLQKVRSCDQRFALCIERVDLQADLLKFEFLSHLHSIYYFGCQIELLIKFLDDFVFYHAVSPSQTAFFSLSGSEGEHVVVLVRVGFPQETEEWEFEILPSVFPVVVDGFGEFIGEVHLQEFLVFLFEECGHPALVAGKRHVLAGLEFELGDGLFEEVVSQHLFALEEESVLVGFDESVVHLSEFIAVGGGKVELGGQTDVVWRNFCEFFNLGDPLHAFYFGYGYFLLFVGSDRFGFISGYDDECVFVGVELIELLLGGDELEGFGPIESFAVAHNSRLNKYIVTVIPLFLNHQHISQLPYTTRPNIDSSAFIG